MKITRAVQTSMACPSQWDAWDEEGNYYYLRYRHGWGEMHQYKDENWQEAPFPEGTEVTFRNVHSANPEHIRLVTEFRHGDPLDGMISLSKFAELAGFELADDLMETSFGEHLRDQLVQEGFMFLLESEPPE